MTFIKITDPKQRKALARELHETIRTIQASNLQHRLYKIGLSRDLSKMFKPVDEHQRKAAKNITKTIEDLPVPALPPPPPKFADPLPITPSTDTVLGPRAQQYSQLSVIPYVDHTFGLRSEENVIFIGMPPVIFEGDDIFVDGVRYKATPGIWELKVKKKPESFESQDLDDYEEILKNSGAVHQGNFTLSRTPKANKSYKWTGIVSHIFKKDKSGSGLKTVVLPSNFDQLINRLDLFPLVFTIADSSTGVCLLRAAGKNQDTSL